MEVEGSKGRTEDPRRTVTSDDLIRVRSYLCSEDEGGSKCAKKGA